jgi:cell division protein FtsB
VKVDLGIWNKLTQAVIVLVVIAILIFIGLAYLEPIHQNERMRKEIYRLDAELKKQESLSKELRAEIDALRNDPATLTRLVREKLGYAKTDEMVIRFETNGVSLPRQ